VDDSEIIEKNDQPDGDDQGADYDSGKAGVAPEAATVIKSSSIHDSIVAATATSFDEISVNGGKRPVNVGQVSDLSDLREPAAPRSTAR
jgi:hypothetical protein